MNVTTCTLKTRDELTGNELTVWRDEHVTTWLCDELTDNGWNLAWSRGGGFRGQQVLAILVNFGPLILGAQIFVRSYLGHFKIFAWLGVWPIDISSPNLVNFDSGVDRIKPQVMPSLVSSTVAIALTAWRRISHNFTIPSYFHNIAHSHAKEYLSTQTGSWRK